MPSLRDAVDVGRFVAHQAVAVAAEIGDADVVAEDDEDVRLLAARRRLVIALRNVAEQTTCGHHANGRQELSLEHGDVSLELPFTTLRKSSTKSEVRALRF